MTSTPATAQSTYLSTDSITPALITDTLSQLPTQQSLWVATAVLYTLSDGMNTSKVADIESVHELLRIGISACDSGTGQDDTTRRSIRAQLLLIQHSLTAFEKTGVRAVRQGEQDDEGDEQDDEDSPWFDTQAATPSPSPQPAQVPTIELTTLLNALSNPLSLAKTLAPNPDRLVVWLNNISREVYQEDVEPKYLEVVQAALRFAGISGQDIQDVKNAGILPSLNGSDVWARLGTKSDSTTLLTFYLAESRNLEEKFGNPSAALQLAQYACAIAQSDATPIRRQLGEFAWQLDIYVQFGAEEQSSSSSTFKHRLLSQPQQQLVQLLEDPQHDLQTITKLLHFIASHRPHLSPQVVLREAVFELYQRKQVLALHLLPNKDEATDVAVSLLLAGGDVTAVKGLGEVLQGGSSTSASPTSLAALRRSFPRLDKDISRTLAATPPSAKAIYHQLTADGSLSSEQRILLRNRCAGATQLHSQINDASSLSSALQRIPPWLIVLSQGQRDAQLAVLKYIIQEALPSCRDSDDCIALASSIRSSLVATSLLDELTDEENTTSELLTALLSQERFDVFPEVARSITQDDTILQRAIITSAQVHFDKASGGRGGVTDLKKARSCLALSTSDSPLIQASQSFLSAVIRLMQVSPSLSSSLHPSLPLAPLEIRSARDKLAVIKTWLGRGEDGAWKRADDVLETAWGLCEGSVAGALGNNSDEHTTAAPNKHLIQVQIYAMLSESSIAHNDLPLTSTYIQDLLKAYKTLVRKTKSSSLLSSARETLWLTLFSTSKHPNASQEPTLTRYWLAEALAHAPIERSAELLRRWKSLDDESSRNLAVPSLYTTSASPSTSLLRLPTVATELGAGVFGLAAGAVARAQQAADSTAPYSRAGLGNALSSLAGGYSRSLTGFLGGGGGGGEQQHVDDTPSAQPSQPPTRSAASLFDSLGERERQRDTPSPHQQYLDPAERAARAARGFLSGWRGSAANSTSRSASPAGSGGWAARGMDWLLDDNNSDTHK